MAEVMKCLTKQQMVEEPVELKVCLWETSRKVSSDFAPNDWKRLTIKSMVRRYLWETSRKVSSDFAPNDWKRLTIKSMVRKYTEHPSAVRFSAPQAEPASRNYSRTERICRIVISSDHPILLPNPDYILKLTHC